MQEVFKVTLQQLVIMFSFMAIGYVLSKRKILSEAKPFSTVLMWVFLPAVVFDVFYKNFTVSNLVKALPYFIAGLVLLGVTVVIFTFMLKKYKHRITRNTYLYSMVVSNMAYMGFPLIKEVFSEQMYLFFVIYTIGIHIYVFTVGVMMFAPESKKFSLKGLLSPIMIALVLGLVCGPIFDVADFKMPLVFEKIINTAAGCMSPIAMLITGITLARLSYKELFNKKEVYLFTAMRLLIIPAVIGGIAYLCHLAFGLPIGIVQMTILYCALPMGLNPVVFAEANGEDGTLGAQCAFISHILCLVTLPFVFGLVAIL